MKLSKVKIHGEKLIQREKVEITSNIIENRKIRNNGFYINRKVVDKNEEYDGLNKRI